VTSRRLRKTLYENGIPVDPRSIAVTHDNGFVIAGSLGGNPAWVIRIGPDGNVVWRYVLPLVFTAARTMEFSYASVMQLPDDSTLLCGPGISGSDASRDILVVLMPFVFRPSLLCERRRPFCLPRRTTPAFIRGGVAAAPRCNLSLVPGRIPAIAPAKGARLVGSGAL
jgi:hypothetical protein